MEKIWLNSYPLGVDHNVDLNHYPKTLNEIFDESVQAFSGRTAFSSLGCALTFQSLDHKSRQVAAYLQDVGLEKGDRVALMLPNLLQYPICLLAILRAGFVVVNLNPLDKAKTLKHQLVDSSAKALVVLENFAFEIEKVIAQTSVKHVLITQVGDCLSPLKRYLINAVIKHVKKQVPKHQLVGKPLAVALNGDQTFNPPASVGPDDLAFLQYTGATTGIAKGVMLTHGNMVANLAQIQAWFDPYLRGDELMITALPLYHIFSLQVNCLLMLRKGAHSLLIPNPRDMKAFIKTLKSCQMTAITGVNTLYNGMMHHKDFSDIDFSKLHLSIGGGMAVQHMVAEKWRETTGCSILQGYGLTEASPVVCMGLPNELEFTGSIGLPAPGSDIEIRDHAGQAVPTCEVGELCVKGPQVSQGYWNNPEQTQHTFENGWLKTGDMAYMTQAGYVHIVDRKKDMVVVSGFNVYPTEVEDTLASMPEVCEAAVIGVKDSLQGERLKAYVVLESGVQITQETIIERCRAEIAAYKVPRVIEFCADLPKSFVGKVMRRELREQAQGEEYSVRNETITGTSKEGV